MSIPNFIFNLSRYIFYIPLLPIHLFVLPIQLVNKCTTKSLNKKNSKESLVTISKFLNMDPRTIKVEIHHKLTSYTYKTSPNHYTIKISSNCLLCRESTLLHELYHIKKGDLDDHKKTILGAISTAFTYIWIWEPRTILFEIRNARNL